MKKNVSIVLLMTACAVIATPYLPFRSWDEVKRRSPDIVIARCAKTPDQATIKDAVFESEVEIECVLKGTTNLRPATVDSSYRLRQGEHYLIFSIFSDGVYQTAEEYRIIPLGHYFSTNVLTGKLLDEQIQFLLQYRLNNLNRELQQGQEEKKRLEEGLKK